jgi:serine/threonine protein kinase
VNDPFNPPGSLPPRSNNAMPPGSVVGDFTIQELVGEGGFAIVYRALDNVTQHEVAIKEFMPNAIARRGSDGHVELLSPQYTATFQAGRTSFVSEAKLLAQFDHKALVKVLRVFETHDTAYMVMPFYHGRTLKQILRELTKMDEPWVKAMLAPLLDALEMLHGARRLHCDVAPGNILMLDDGGPVLLDFGAARRVIGSMAPEMNGVINAGYAPVEQYAADSSMQQGPWTDIYALAAVVRHAIMGKLPPPSVTRVVKDPVKPLAQVATRFGPSFLRAIDYGFAVQPEDRPQSIAEFRQALGLAVVSVRLPTPAPTGIASAPPVTTQHVAAVLKPPPASSPQPAADATGPIGEKVRMHSHGPLPLTPASAPAAKPAHGLSRPPPASGASSRRRWFPIAIVLVTVSVVFGAGYLALQSVTSEPSRERVAHVPAPTAPVMPPRAPTPAAVEPTPEAATPPPAAPHSPQPAAGPAAAAPPVASPAPSAAPTPPTGRVMLAIKPWGEVMIDGRARGLTPPLKFLQRPEGAHRIEVRNPVGPPLVREVRVTAAGRVEISHTFK